MRASLSSSRADADDLCQVAEKLYQQRFVSYPRTETDRV